ncbi:hypothetical protein SADUNF_Sadunf09G0022700 [Salix dunnii]|uniref:Secreted protein n=1 Tax=Salix dunnii TaxID=1413687 RepID=A0A835JQ55_9ROSI|nr:hypothetical protein SADUNF_Sadunf09G0022700 [Salix dunnii]
MIEIIAVSGLLTGIVFCSLLFVVCGSGPGVDDEDHGDAEDKAETGNNHDIESNGTGNRNQQAETAQTRLEALRKSFVSDKNSGSTSDPALFLI